MLKKLIIFLNIFAIANNLDCAAAADGIYILDKEKDESTKCVFSLLADGPTKVHILNIKLCIELGANVVDATNENGLTHLMVAAKSGWLDAVALLIANGSSVNKEDNDGNTALMLANDNGYEGVVRFLIHNGAKIKQASDRSPISLYWLELVRSKDIDGIQLLIDLGVNINCGYGRSALIMGSECADMVKLLVCNGVDIDVKSDLGNTALITACLANRKLAPKLLIENGANVNIQNNLGTTALMWACKRKNTDLVQFLIRNGADVNIQNNQGDNALTWACNSGHADLVQLLIHYGAKINIQDVENISRLLMMHELPSEL